MSAARQPVPAPTANRVAALPVAVALLLVTAGCSGALPGVGTGSGSPSTVETVPGTADVVVHVDVVGYRSDGTLRELSEANLSDAREGTPGPGEDTGTPFDDPETVAALANATRVDLEDLRSVTVFARYPELPTEGEIAAAPAGPVAATERAATPGGEGYGGVVVTADWTAADLVATLENVSRVASAAGNDTEGSPAVGGATVEGPDEPVDLEATTYRGHTLYVPANDSRDGAVGVLGEGQFALGTGAAVRDAIDVREGALDPMNGTLRAAYDTTPGDAYFRFAATVPREAIPDGVFETDSAFNTEVFTNVTAVSAAQYTDGDDIGFRVGLLFTDAGTARDAADVLDGVRSTYRGLVDNETASEFLADENLTVERTDATVTVTSENSVEFWKRTLRILASLDGVGDDGPGTPV